MLKLKLQYLGHLMWRANSLKKTLMLAKIESKRRRGQQRMRWLDSIKDSMKLSELKLSEIVKDKGAWRAAVHGVTKWWTQLIDWTTTRVATMVVYGSNKDCKFNCDLCWWEPPSYSLIMKIANFYWALSTCQALCITVSHIISLWWVIPNTMEKPMATHSSTLAWKIHGWRSLVGCSPWSR